MAELYPSNNKRHEILGFGLSNRRGVRERGDSESDLIAELHPSKKLKLEHYETVSCKEGDEEGYSSNEKENKEDDSSEEGLGFSKQRGTRERGDSESDLMEELHLSKKLKLEHYETHSCKEEDEEGDSSNEEDDSSEEGMEVTSACRTRYPSCEEDDSNSIMGNTSSMKAILEKSVELAKVQPLLVIECKALHPDHAYRALNILYDPRGVRIGVMGPEGKDSRTLEFAMEYLLLLKKLGTNDYHTIRAWGFVKNHPWTIYLKALHLSPEMIYSCIQDSQDVYCWKRKIADWNIIHESLFGANPRPKDKYMNDKDYAHYMEDVLVRSRISYSDNGRLWKAVTVWWKSGLDEDKKKAEIVSNNILNEYIRLDKERLLDGRYLYGDYLKLKLDVAVKLGIVPELHDELKYFVLPGHEDMWQQTAF